MHDGLAAHEVAAAGHGDPELLADGDPVGVGDVVGGGDVLVGDEAREDAPRDGVERVPGADPVRGPLERGPGAPRAEAGQADPQRHGSGRRGRRGEREAVGGQQRAVGAELEERAHGGERGRGRPVGRRVGDERLARGRSRRRGVAREPRRPRRGARRGEEAEEEPEAGHEGSGERRHCCAVARFSLASVPLLLLWGWGWGLGWFGRLNVGEAHWRGGRGEWGSVQQRAGRWAWWSWSVVSLSIAARSKLSLTRNPYRPPLPARLGSRVKGVVGDDSVSLVPSGVCTVSRWGWGEDRTSVGAGSLACTEHLAGILCARWNRSLTLHADGSSLPPARRERLRCVGDRRKFLTVGEL